MRTREAHAAFKPNENIEVGRVFQYGPLEKGRRGIKTGYFNNTNCVLVYVTAGDRAGGSEDTEQKLGHQPDGCRTGPVKTEKGH